MPRLRAPARCSFSSSVRPSAAEARGEAFDVLVLLPDRAAGRRGADDREPADQKLRQVDLALGAAHEADHNEPPAGRERGQVVREIGGADVVEDDVDAAPAGELAGPRAEVLAAVVDGGCRAERHALPALLVAAGGGAEGDCGPAAQEGGRRAPPAPSGPRRRPPPAGCGAR